MSIKLITPEEPIFHFEEHSMLVLRRAHSVLAAGFVGFLRRSIEYAS